MIKPTGRISVGIFVMSKFSALGFVGGLIAASLSTGRAVEEAVLAEPYVNLSLTEGAVLLALTLVFRHFALHTLIFLGRGGHKRNVARALGGGKCRW